MTPGPFQKELGALAQVKLESAGELLSGDASAQEARGYALWLQGRGEDGLAAYEIALAKAPRLERALVEAAELATRLGQRGRAIGYWQRAIAVDPYRSAYHSQLADLYAEGRQWEPARKACQKALALNPAHLQARKLLIRCYQRLKDPRKAQAEFDILLGFDPPDKKALQEWFTHPE
jgi:tetratricopeptide (TPR) repeat protein